MTRCGWISCSASARSGCSGRGIGSVTCGDCCASTTEARSKCIPRAPGSREGISATRSRCPYPSKNRTIRGSWHVRTGSRSVRFFSGASIRGDDDDAARRGGAVIRRRIHAVQHPDGENVRGGDLLQDLNVFQTHMVEEDSHLIVEVDTGAPSSLNPCGLAATLSQLHVGNRKPHRVPRGPSA